MHPIFRYSKNKKFKQVIQLTLEIDVWRCDCDWDCVFTCRMKEMEKTKRPNNIPLYWKWISWKVKEFESLWMREMNLYDNIKKNCLCVIRSTRKSPAFKNVIAKVMNFFIASVDSFFVFLLFHCFVKLENKTKWLKEYFHRIWTRKSTEAVQERESYRLQ